MAEQSRNNERAGSKKSPKKRLRLVIIIVTILFLCLFFWFARQYLSVDKKLAAIDAARAIPDSENATIIYNQLLEDYNYSYFKPDILTPEVHDITISESWPNKDYPELAKWIEEQHDFIEKILNASEFDKCQFPVTDFPKDPNLHGQRLATMRRWAYFLVIAANNDIAEGRIEKGVEKYLCIVRMGRHLHQQPVAFDFLVGISLESLALRRLRFMLLSSDLEEEYLQKIEKALPATNDDWDQIYETIYKIEKLYVRKLPTPSAQGGLWKRLKTWWQNSRNIKITFDKIHEIYTNLLVDRKEMKVQIATQRYKNKTGQQIENLDELIPFLDKDTLIDLEK